MSPGAGAGKRPTAAPFPQALRLLADHDLPIVPRQLTAASTSPQAMFTRPVVAGRRGSRYNRAMDDRDRLLERLRKSGCSKEELEQATAEGRIPTLAVERALGSPDLHTTTAVAREAKLDPAFLKQLMQAMGRPAQVPRRRNLTDDDLAVARLVRGFLDAGLPRAEVLEVARVLSLGMSHTTEAVRRVVGDALLHQGDSEYTLALRYVEAVDELAPLIPALLTAEFRAHLCHGIRNHLVTEAELE
ncbi:MAG: hypothetical protein NVS2B6_11520 [Thermoleophilaceae bacterium]